MATKKTAAKKTIANATTKKTTKATSKSVAKAKRPTTKKSPAKQADAKTERLRKPQLRILEALAKTKAALTRKEIAESASVDQASLVEYLGSPDPVRRKANDAKHFPSLVTLKFAKVDEYEYGSTAYTITAAGRKAAKGVADA